MTRTHDLCRCGDYLLRHRPACQLCLCREFKPARLIRLSDSDRRTLGLICALDGGALTAVLLLAAVTPYDLQPYHLLMVVCWWIGAVMAWAYTRRRLGAS